MNALGKIRSAHAAQTARAEAERSERSHQLCASLGAQLVAATTRGLDRLGLDSSDLTVTIDVDTVVSHLEPLVVEGSFDSEQACVSTIHVLSSRYAPLANIPVELTGLEGRPFTLRLASSFEDSFADHLDDICFTAELVESGRAIGALTDIAV